MRVLVAEEESVMSYVTSALDGYELVRVFTVEQAERMILEDGIDLVLVGIHFDDSRAMQLIQRVRADKAHHSIPIIVHRLCHSEYSGTLRQSLDALISMRIVDMYLELEGVPFAKEVIRDAIDAFATKSSRL